MKSAMTELPWSSVELPPSHESYVYGADVYMCMHTYLHIIYYTHTHTHVYIYIYIYIYIYTYIYIYINIHMHTYMHIYICTCMIHTHEAYVNTSYTLSVAQGCIARGSAGAVPLSFVPQHISTHAHSLTHTISHTLFRSGVYCEGQCNCHSCHNNPRFEIDRQVCRV